MKTHPNRDVDADYQAAYLAEYDKYKAAGLDDLAAGVEAVLLGLGVDVRPKQKEAPVKERAVSPEPTEKAVDVEKRGPGRPSTKK